MKLKNRWLLIFVYFWCCSMITPAEGGQGVLSDSAEEIAKVIKFDRRVLVTMKEESGASIHRMIGYDENDFQIMVDGVFVPVPTDKTENVLYALRKKLSSLKYMAFIIEINENIKTDKIGVLKGTDEYEILRVMHTDGSDYEISNQDVIDRLKEWKKMSSFDIVGADNDWLEIEFKVLPKDVKTFAQEVYEFCPDTVDQGAGTVVELAKDIQQTKKLVLWWE